MSTATSVPECVADHQVGELVLAVNNNGTFGTGFQEAASGDCFTGGQVKSCEYPKGSNQSYLFAGSFWIGAVVGRDTLVSVGADGWSFTRELTPDRHRMTKRSIIDPNSPEYEEAVSEEDIVSYYTDSVTSSVAADPFDGPHRPLYINVAEASYAWSYAYAEDFVLFDYQITNIGSRTLENVYMGLYNDGDVCFDCGNGGYSDDLTGFLQTIDREYGSCTYRDTVFIAWLADNNGDLQELHPVPNVTGMRVIRTPAETLDVSYAYASSYQKPLSVPQSLILLMSRYGMNVRLVHPPEYKLMPDIVQQAADNAKASGGSFEIMDDMDAGFEGADIVYPKSWGSWLTTEDEAESVEIGKQYTSWICDERRMGLAKQDAIYMHCLPADRNIEVTDGVIDGPNSVVYDEAENRLHVQKSVMALTMN